MPEQEIKIYLTTPEAVMFRNYQQFHETFALMVRTGVFDCRNGSVTIHFDNESTIRKIERNDSLFDVRVKNVL